MEVRYIDSIQVTVDDVIYNLWGMKEPNYVTRMMATGVCLLADDTCNDTVRRWKENGEDVVKKFKYKLKFDWYFYYRHAVDDHNSLSHALPPIEYKWTTDRWECRLFALIFYISEVNAFFIIRYFVYCGLCWEGTPTLLEFRRKLVGKLINNIYFGEWILEL